MILASAIHNMGTICKKISWQASTLFDSLYFLLWIKKRKTQSSELFSNLKLDSLESVEEIPKGDWSLKGSLSLSLTQNMFYKKPCRNFYIFISWLYALSFVRFLKEILRVSPLDMSFLIISEFLIAMLIWIFPPILLQRFKFLTVITWGFKI